MPELPPAEERILKLLEAAAMKQKPCSYCGATLYFITLKSGRLAPYTAQGINHFVDCPQAQQFRRRKHA